MQLKNKKLILTSFLLTAACLFLPAMAFAAGEVPTVAMFGGVFGDATLAQIIIRIVQLFLAALGFIALIFIMYAGFTWMTASGDPDKVNKAKRMIQQVVIGLIVISSAFAVTAFIYDRFAPPGAGGTGATGGTGVGGTFDYWSNYPPEIAYISPALDVLGNTDQNRLPATSTSDDISNGAPGNYISIIGRYFGSAGKVYFVKKGGTARVEAKLAPCARPWSNNLIIALVPAGLDKSGADGEAAVAAQNPLRNYDVIVVKDANAPSPLESNPWGFQVNGVERPGICSMAPDHGAYPATSTLSGFKFPTSEPRSIVWSIAPNHATSTGSSWSSSSAVDIIPQDLAGRSLVSVFNGESYSNSFLFMVSSGNLGSPCGYDTQSCREDVSTCVGSENLACQYCSTDLAAANYQAGCVTSKNCTCQPKVDESCAYDSDPALNAKRACSTGGCGGFEFCSAKGVWSRSCQLTDPACIPFLGNKSNIAAFSWSFSALKKPAAGMSCLSETWNDGTCDLNGCIDPDLACDPLATADHPACTCVPKSELCVAGKTDAAACPVLGACAQVRTCLDNGHWGICAQVDPSCIPYPLVPASTIAAYSWTFGADGNAGDAGPMVVSECGGSIDCSKNRLPSPSPWSQWTAANAAVQNELACLNAEIYARFTQAVDSATLNAANIRLYKSAGGIWTDQTDAKVDQIEPLLSEGDGGSADSFAIRLKAGVDLDAAADYRVFLNKKIRDEVGRNLIDNPNGVNQSLCSEASAAGLPTEAGVCWSFTTRPAGADAICQIGCVNCGPNKYFNRFYGQEKEHKVTPISLDNSCISLNNRDYAWDWSEQEQGAGGGDFNAQTNVSIQKNMSLAFSWVKGAIDGLGIFSQPADTVSTGYGTTTALQESRWKTNAEYKSWFGADDFDYFGVNGRVHATGHFGVCAAHNNFTDPIVIENQYCTKSDALNKQVLQSPSPWKGQTDACTNAAIFVLFSRNMQDASLLNSNGTVKNFEIYKCSSPAAATSSNFATYKNDCAAQSGWTAKVFNYTHRNITFQDLLDAPNSVYGSLIPEGVEIVPPGKAELDVNAWYKVVIRGGSAGVRGAATSTAGSEVPEGVLQVPSANARINDGSNDWYYWYFKTGQGSCPIDQIAVLPQLKFMPAVGETEEYLADPYAANCNHLNPNRYKWKWDSLINPFVDRCPADNSNPSSGDYVATVCDKAADSCSSAAEPDAADVKAFGQNEGSTKITAAAVQGNCQSNKFGAGDLQIGFGGFKVTSNENTDCLNTDINVGFSQDAISASVLQSGNFALYECADSQCAVIDESKKINLKINHPAGSIASPDPLFTNHVDSVPVNNLVPGATYRAVVKGGLSGVRSAVGSGLTGLNFQFVPNNGGEACDPALYPWRSGDPESGNCAATCKFDAAKSLCGTLSQECATKNSTVTDPANYCNAATCQALGNTNKASCGNGKIEPGEDCDDGNVIDGDSCSSKCLLEGSNIRYNSICGNSRIEKGEQCDDGNIIDGDGCSAKCLNSTNSGSTPNVPICGNGRIEFGEQCDDGANNDVSGGTSKRCTNNCLLSGKGGSCGNGKLENGQFDSYSWTFSLKDGARVCQPINFDLNPCPNGVWSLTADPSVDNLKVVFYKGSAADTGGCISDAEMRKIGFWRGVWERLARIIKSFFGFRYAVAANFWCPISGEADGTFTADDLSAMRRGNYKRDISIDAVNTEIIAYPNDSNSNKINFIRTQNWEKNTEYKAVAAYSRKGAAATRTAGVTTYDKSCKIEKAKFDVWPRGDAKTSDAFFCASDPATAKTDECGRLSPDLYDDDMSAPWTASQSGNGYNLSGNGDTTAANIEDYKGGNQHLYRVWPIDSHGFILRGTKFDATLDNIGTQTAQAEIANTDYAGDFWMTSGFKPGRSMFNVSISDAVDPSAGSKPGTLPIYTFFCNKPWPDAQNFPFIDSSANCQAGTGSCINTNFGTYYCRDAGKDKVCDAAGNCSLYTADDLPSIANYNAASKTFSAGTGVVSGNYGNTCAPNDKTCDNKLKEFLFTGTAGNATSSEAIGLRMYNNNNHYSPELWYKSRFNPGLQGNLAKLTVDGYGAAQEGRTVYVNAGDFSDDYLSLYTNMYLMSYDQGAGKTTENIYNQLVANWFFNAGDSLSGGLEYNEALGYCSQGGATADNMCYTDLDCVKRNAGFCKSAVGDNLHTAYKAKVTRDTQRLADVQDIYSTFSGYYNKLRCSNDFTRACSNNTGCFGGGTCGHFYPNLQSGTYITGKTFSVWPSWQDNLAKELGAKLPVDPINRLWAWVDGRSVDCSNPYNSVTCWDQTNKKMTTDAAGNCNVDFDSSVYLYDGTKTGVSANVFAKGEVYRDGANWKPDWQFVNNFTSGLNPFNGYNSQITGKQFCVAAPYTCGNGIPNEAGENCSNCPQDYNCTGKVCQQNASKEWVCGPLRDCGDGVKQPGEECDPLISPSGSCTTCSPAGGCQNGCKIVDGYRMNAFGIIAPVCGDGVKTGAEQCEFINGAPFDGMIDGKPNYVTATFNGLLACTDQCQYASWYADVNKNPKCGDGLRTDQEECDCGTAGSNPLISPARNNPFACPTLNSAFGSVYTNDPAAILLDYTFCDTSCRRHDKGNYAYCGDGVVTSPQEVCDFKNDPNCNSTCNGPKFSGGGCANGCCFAPNDRACSSACGEVPAGCGSDCAECARGAVCCNTAGNACTLYRDTAYPPDKTKYCDANGLPVPNCAIIKPHSTLQGGVCVCDAAYPQAVSTVSDAGISKDYCTKQCLSVVKGDVQIPINGLVTASDLAQLDIALGKINTNTFSQAFLDAQYCLDADYNHIINKNDSLCVNNILRGRPCN